MRGRTDCVTAVLHEDKQLKCWRGKLSGFLKRTLYLLSESLWSAEMTLHVWLQESSELRLLNELHVVASCYDAQSEVEGAELRKGDT